MAETPRPDSPPPMYDGEEPTSNSIESTVNNEKIEVSVQPAPIFNVENYTERGDENEIENRRKTTITVEPQSGIDIQSVHKESEEEEKGSCCDTCKIFACFFCLACGFCLSNMH